MRKLVLVFEPHKTITSFSLTFHPVPAAVGLFDSLPELLNVISLALEWHIHIPAVPSPLIVRKAHALCVVLALAVSISASSWHQNVNSPSSNSSTRSMRSAPSAITW